jgi:hypothetical protein
MTINTASTSVSMLPVCPFKTTVEMKQHASKLADIHRLESYIQQEHIIPQPTVSSVLLFAARMNAWQCSRRTMRKNITFSPHTRWSQNFTNPTCRSEHTFKTKCQTYPTVTHVDEGRKYLR